MAKNEEGEFELVLGNRQLISVFLIVVILLAVFFSMGYIVGRNSAPGTAPETARNAGSSAPEAPQKASPSSPAAAPQETPSAQAAEAPTTTHAEAPAATHGDTPAATHAEQPAAAHGKPEPVSTAPVAAAKPKPEPAAERVAATGEPGPGQYWQVVATARPDAEIIAEALTKKGFRAMVSPAPKEGVYRVLVGPLKDAPSQAQTRTELEAAGFKNPLMRKY